MDSVIPVRTVTMDEVRCIHYRAALRSTPDITMPVITVRFSPFNKWYEIDSWMEGLFMERTMPGAFKKTIKENNGNIKILFDHGYDMQIGNKVLAPVEELFEDKDSPVGEGTLLDTSYNRDLMPALEKGLYGSSFRFRVIKDEWNDEPEPSDYNPRGIPERTIREVRVFEFGPTPFPANDEASAGLRSLTDHYHQRGRARNEERFQALSDAVRSVRTSRTGGAAPSTPGREEATGKPVEPSLTLLGVAEREAYLRSLTLSGFRSNSHGKIGSSSQ